MPSYSEVSTRSVTTTSAKSGSTAAVVSVVGAVWVVRTYQSATPTPITVTIRASIHHLDLRVAGEVSVPGNISRFGVSRVSGNVIVCLPFRRGRANCSSHRCRPGQPTLSPSSLNPGLPPGPPAKLGTKSWHCSMAA